ncbi:MAG: hypothetical protein HY082_10240 [Gammaproteobacteria bacterium]|nr:hypothetical protein [Gammaproteobacteria bacterium]
MPNSLKQLLQWLGPLRIMLMLGALVTLVLRPAPGTKAIYAGWEMVPTVLVPTLVPMIFMVLLLDAIMGAVLHASRSREQRRYRAVIAIDLVLATALVLWWWPFFAVLGR